MKLRSSMVWGIKGHLKVGEMIPYCTAHNQEGSPILDRIFGYRGSIFYICGCCSNPYIRCYKRSHSSVYTNSGRRIKGLKTNKQKALLVPRVTCSVDSNLKVLAWWACENGNYGGKGRSLCMLSRYRLPISNTSMFAATAWHPDIQRQTPNSSDSLIAPFCMESNQSHGTTMIWAVNTLVRCLAQTRDHTKMSSVIF